MKLKQFLPMVPEPLRDWYLNLNYERQLKNWNARGQISPIPHIIKQLAIKSFQKKYDVNTLVETGTYMGDMVYAQRKLFKKIYTIELSDKLHEMCSRRLRKYKNIETIKGDSGVVLEHVIKEIKEKSIFWLDGHYSGEGTAKSDEYSPIIEEIRMILDSKIEHIILIDDARDFDGSNGYPTIEALFSMIKSSIFPNSAIEMKDDIIRIELKS